MGVVPDTPSLADVVIEAVAGARDELVALTLHLSSLPDLSGSELPVAEAVADWFATNGIDASLQPLSPTSANVIARVGGGDDDSVPALMLSSHLDTEGAPPDGDDDERRHLRGAWRDGDLLVGKGLVNDRTQLAAMLVAMRALVAAGAPIDGGLLFLGTAQECSPPVSVPEFLGRDEAPHGAEGAGARWAMDHGIRARFALVGEPTGFAVSGAQAGYLRVRIAVPGYIPYTPFVQRGEGPLGTTNPLERAGVVITRLVAWAADYERREWFPFPGGTVVPKAQIQDIRRVWPLFTQTDDACDIHLDIRTAPGREDAAVVTQLEALLADLPFACEIVVYERQTGHVGIGAESVVAAVRGAHERLFGEPPGEPRPAQVSMWHDSNAFNAAGIPAVSYGIAPVPEAFTRERFRAARVDDLVRLAQVYALAALEVTR